MEENSRRGNKSAAAARVGVHRNTASKYLKSGKLPSEMAKPRTWRTRGDPFADVWEGEIVWRVREAPELEAKTLFEHLDLTFPGKYKPGQLRTLQRRLQLWRAAEGPPRSVFFAQIHRPGEAMQTDFTWMTELGITILGEPFAHMVCHVVLPYSNWSWVTICRSESMQALRAGVQAAVYRLGRVPEWHQTDNSTAATHDLPSGKRGFNPEYEALMRHLGMKPRTIEVGEKNQNGDVEAMHRSLKSRLNQHLLMRRSRDFEDLEQYAAWLQEIVEKGNALRADKLLPELDAMKVLRVARLPEYRELEVVVSPWSTIRVKNNAYSVPSRLIGEYVKVRLYEDRLEVYYAGERQLSADRILGRNGHRIDYRHIIWSLVQKPGAFHRYRYREDLFPTLIFRQAYDALVEAHGERRASIEYLRILHLAASTMECDVARALEMLLDMSQRFTHESVKELVVPDRVAVPELQPLDVDLSGYDALLRQGA